MTTDAILMKPDRDVGIAGYGAYVPRFRLPASEVARVWTDGVGGLPIKEKAVPGLDEDTATMGLEAARNALARAEVDPAQIRAVWVGSESHPYAVKPTSTIVAEAIGATPTTLAGDWEFACKAGSEALQAAIALVGSGMGDFALAIGADTAQGRPGDALEYTTGAGAAAYIIGPRKESLAYFEASYSYVTDTPDFFRRPYQHFPQHGSRFTGQPAYFEHILASSRALLEALGRQPQDYAYAIFHQPNARFPQRVAKMIGFTPEQIEPGLLATVIGNTYAGSSLMGLSAVLDAAKPGDKIFLASYGSGAGSDAFSLVVTSAVLERQKRAPSTRAYIARRKEIDYATYVRYRKKLHTH
jgi:hydroxymethylglutaryl-CoA synthase